MIGKLKGVLKSCLGIDYLKILKITTKDVQEKELTFLMIVVI